jgi:hypothetical protein
VQLCQTIMSIFQNLKIERLVAHEVFGRKAGSEKHEPPTYSIGLTPLSDGQVKETIERRIINSLGNNKHCLEMEIVNFDQASTFSKVADSLSLDDEEFILVSQKITEALWDAQQSAGIPGGMVVIATGKIGFPEKRCLCIIKAEKDSGFSTKSKDGAINLDYVSNVLLTESQKLRKVAIFIESSPLEELSKDRFSIFVSDLTLQFRDHVIQANYFVRKFLGCKAADTSKIQTKAFFELTSDFISSLPVSEHDKISSVDALYSYVSSNNNSINVEEFAKNHLPSSISADDYVNQMKDKVPENGISKDNSLIERRIKRRNLIFDNDIKIVGPSDQFNNLVEVIDDDDENTVTIKIRGRLKGQ